MKDNPVLKMLGQRNTTDSDTMVWIALILLLLPIILLLGNYLRLYLHRRQNRAQSYDQLEKLAGEKGLSYSEQVVVESLADAANLNHPAQLLSSIETFDRAVTAYMQKVEALPWLEMEEQVERLSTIRKKTGFQYLSPERPPTTTRELKIGQKVYSLAASPKGVRLIYAEIFDINDLAIFVRPFRTAKNTIKLGKKNAIWGFFWSEGGNEYRFRTHALKEIMRPAQYLLIKHGDTLYHNSQREVFVCDQNIELVVEWISSQTQNNVQSPKIFDRIENPDTVALSLTHISGSGFGLSFDGQLDVDDLVRIKGGNGLPSFMENQIGRVIKIGGDIMSCRFLTMTPEKHHQLLNFIASHLTVDAFQSRLKRAPRKSRK